MSRSPVPQVDEKMSAGSESEGQLALVGSGLGGDQNLTSASSLQPVAQEMSLERPTVTSVFQTPPSPLMDENPLQSMEQRSAVEEHLADAQSDDQGRQKSSPAATPKPIQFDPKALLNPKSGNRLQEANGRGSLSPRKRSATPNTKGVSSVPELQFDFAKTSEARLEDEQDGENEAESNGISTLLEKTHGVTERELSAVKRQKTTHDVNSASWSGAKGGEISKHFQDLKKEEAQRSQQNGEEGPAVQKGSQAASSEDSSRPEALQQTSQSQIIDLTEGKLQAIYLRHRS